MMVADSDVLIDALRRKDPAASRVTLELKTGALAATAMLLKRNRERFARVPGP